MYLRVVACEVLLREVCHLAATAPHVCDVDLLTQGYHDRVNEGREAIQAIIDEPTDRAYDAILLGYGLCNNLVAGLRAGRVPLVVPRGHDCITFLLGSKEAYEEQFRATPGTYYYSSGWLECRTRRGGIDIAQTGGSLTTQFEELVAKYGEDNARYLVEALSAWTEHYERGALIHFGFEELSAMERRVREVCEEHGWRFELLTGDLGLLRRWLHGDWAPREFLVVQPGEVIQPAWDGSVLKAVPVADA